MAQFNRRHQPINGNINASGNSGALPNLGRSLNPVIVAYLDVKGTVTGTTPSLTVKVQGSMDGTRWFDLATFTAVTATLTSPQRLTVSDVLEPYIQVSWLVSGTGATFNGVTCDVLMTAPDA